MFTVQSPKAPKSRSYLSFCYCFNCFYLHFRL